MIDVMTTDLDGRVRALNDRPVELGGAKYVLCWVQQTLRSHDNPLIDAAVVLGNQLELPVLVYHGLRQDYPHASDRLHAFILGASRDLQAGCRARGLRAVTYVERMGFEQKGLLYRLASDSAAVITDDQPVFVARWQANAFAQKWQRQVLAVDTARLVPTHVLPTGLKTTPAFRAASTPLRATYEAHACDFASTQPPYDGPLCFEDHDIAAMNDAELAAIVTVCDIDHTVPAQEAFEPSAAAASAALARFVTDNLARYAYRRNNPADETGVSRLSPYLHFGLLGPRSIVRAVRASGAPRSTQWKFLDELLTWREWFHYLAAHSPHPEILNNLPSAAQKTLLAHADDERPVIYPLSALLHGETDDETWNAAQRQWLVDGYMHNNLRMYWGKRLIEWTSDPQSAWITACYINDRLSLDGRDPATYGNMQWCFGRARPGYSERPVYGWVTPKKDTALRKRPNAEAWLTAKATMMTPRIHVPAQAFLATGFLDRLLVAPMDQLSGGS